MAVVYRSAHIEAARLASNHRIMDLLAEQVLSNARSSISMHNKTGNYADHLKIEKLRGPSGVSDRLIVSTDPNVKSIEYGHFQGAVGEEGRRWIPGLHIMQAAFIGIPGTMRRFGGSS